MCQFYKNLPVVKTVALIFLFISPSKLWAIEELKKCISSTQNRNLSTINMKQSHRFISCNSLNGDYFVQNTISTNRLESETIAKYYALSSACLGMHWKKTFPIFAAESNFLPIIIGRNGDIGLGQLTTAATKDVQKNANRVLQSILNSSRPSCIDIAKKIKQVGPTEFFNFSPTNKCALTYGETGIFRNIIFSLVFFKINQEYIEAQYRINNIPELLMRAGYENAPHQQIKDMLVLLSYNNGASGAITGLKSYLLSRIDFILRKKEELLFKKVPINELPLFLAHVGAQDFDFSSGHIRFEFWRSSLSKNYPPDKIDQALRNISASQLGFPEWLRIWQSHGGPGYLNGLFQISSAIQKSTTNNLSCFNHSDFKLN